MLGLIKNSWMLELLNAKYPSGRVRATKKGRGDELYTTYFGMGHSIRLQDNPYVFKVSLAGMSLGALLLREVTAAELQGRIWDVGTGSGVLAFLLRGMGAGSVTASDIYPEAVELATRNELLNFDHAAIRFRVEDLFAHQPDSDGRHSLIVFNPPGWRTPSANLRAMLEKSGPEPILPPGAMFHGDEVLRRFLNELPAVLSPGGRAIVGMNSLVGIQDVIKEHRQDWSGRSPLTFRLMERHSLPLLFYSPAWQKAEPMLREEFALWQESHGSAYSEDAQGRIFWSYEIVECRLNDCRE